MTPPVAMGGRAFNLTVTADGQHAVIAHEGPNLYVLDLAPLYQTPDLTADDLYLLGQIVSGQDVLDGDLNTLTTAQWLERYRQFTQEHPQYFAGGLKD